MNKKITEGFWTVNGTKVSWEFYLGNLPDENIVTASFGIVRDNDSILLTKNNRGWEIPGGHIENNETAEEGFIREVKEEVGADVENIQQVGYFSCTSPKPRRRKDNPNECYPFPISYIAFYLANATSIGNTSGDEVLDSRALKISEIKDFDFGNKDIVLRALSASNKNTPKQNMKKFSMILAVDDALGFGKNGDLPWRLKKDMKYFRDKTIQTYSEETTNAVIMGRKTWESIPEKFRPLSGRVNIVLTSNIKYSSPGCIVYSDLEQCLQDIDENKNIEQIFIIGGSSLYNSLLDDPRLEKIYITRVAGNYECDVFFDGIPKDFSMVSEKSEIEKGVKLKFQVYQKNLS